MSSKLYVRKFGYTTAIGQILKIRYDRGDTYDDIMTVVRAFASEYERGRIICESNYAPDTYDDAVIPKIDYLYDPEQAVSSIEDELRDLLNSDHDEWFRIDFTTTNVATKDQHIHMDVKIGGRS